MLTYWLVKTCFPGLTGPDTTFWVKDDGASDFELIEPAQGFNRTWRKISRLAAGLMESLVAAGATGTSVAEPATKPGEFHPRMWRPERRFTARGIHETEFRSAQSAALNLFSEMREVFRYVEPSGNLSAYGHRIRELLTLACIEVEAQCKGVLRANHYRRIDRKGKVVSEKNWNMANDYFKVSRPLRLPGFHLAVRGHPGVSVIDPFAAWANGPGFRPLAWYAAYNDVKHDREHHFAAGTLEHMVAAMAAVYVLVTAQFGQFGNHYAFGYSELDVFDLRASRPEFSLSEMYVPPELGGAGLVLWHPVDYPF